MRKKIFITGGHFTPASAVIEELSKNNWEIFYLGRKHSLEGDKSLSAEYLSLKSSPKVHFLTLTTGRLQRRLTKNTLPSLLKIPVGFLQSFFWIFRHHPAAILSFGSYVGVPVVLAGWLLQIPIIAHEQTLVPSLSSKMILPLSKKIFVSWPKMVLSFPKEKVVLTGNPIRKETFQTNKTAQYEKFQTVKKAHSALKVLYITGGSQGSHSINKVVLESLPELLKSHLIIHQTGSSQEFNDLEALQTKAKSLGKLAQRYFPLDFIDSQNIGWVFTESDIVIGRSGANTVSEIAALAKVAILIPLPWSGGGEAQKNAEMLNEVGKTLIIPQEKLTSPLLLETIAQITRDYAAMKSDALQLKKLINPNSAKTIVDEINKVVV